MNDFPPNRAAALDRLAAFVPKAGRAYAKWRNHDLQGQPHVSGLSPYLRHRIITEDEVLRAVIGAHGAQSASKFIDEVYWRTYWKGWLELRPWVWQDYRIALQAALNRTHVEAGLRANWEAACLGQTGIDGFDDWAKELVETGYLHNHARMWFASIWVFTLGLPWELGADFFLRHLLDGDPASNTLSWRWVAGYHTPGKTYLARSDNIERYTNGRFAPRGLAELAPAPEMRPHAQPGRIAQPQSPDPRRVTGLVLTEEDMSPDWLIRGVDTVKTTAVVKATAARSSLAVAPMVERWVDAALANAQADHGDCLGTLTRCDTVADIHEWAKAMGLQQVVMAHPTVGPTADHLAGLEDRLSADGIRLVLVIRPSDSAAWPRATHGFFKFREAIPKLLAAL